MDYLISEDLLEKVKTLLRGNFVDINEEWGTDTGRTFDEMYTEYISEEPNSFRDEAFDIYTELLSLKPANDQ